MPSTTIPMVSPWTNEPLRRFPAITDSSQFSYPWRNDPSIPSSYPWWWGLIPFPDMRSALANMTGFNASPFARAKILENSPRYTSGAMYRDLPYIVNAATPYEYDIRTKEGQYLATHPVYQNPNWRQAEEQAAAYAENQRNPALGYFNLAQAILFAAGAARAGAQGVKAANANAAEFEAMRAKPAYREQVRVNAPPATLAEARARLEELVRTNAAPGTRPTDAQLLDPANMPQGRYASNVRLGPPDESGQPTILQRWARPPAIQPTVAAIDQARANLRSLLPENAVEPDALSSWAQTRFDAKPSPTVLRAQAASAPETSERVKVVMVGGVPYKSGTEVNLEKLQERLATETDPAVIQQIKQQIVNTRVAHAQSEYQTLPNGAVVTPRLSADGQQQIDPASGKPLYNVKHPDGRVLQVVFKDPRPSEAPPAPPSPAPSGPNDLPPPPSGPDKNNPELNELYRVMVNAHNAEQAASAPKPNLGQRIANWWNTVTGGPRQSKLTLSDLILNENGLGAPVNPERARYDNRYNQEREWRAGAAGQSTQSRFFTGPSAPTGLAAVLARTTPANLATYNTQATGLFDHNFVNPFASTEAQDMQSLAEREARAANATRIFGDDSRVVPARPDSTSVIRPNIGAGVDTTGTLRSVVGTGATTGGTVNTSGNTSVGAKVGTGNSTVAGTRLGTGTSAGTGAGLGANGEYGMVSTSDINAAFNKAMAALAEMQTKNQAERDAAEADMKNYGGQLDTLVNNPIADVVKQQEISPDASFMSSLAANIAAVLNPNINALGQRSQYMAEQNAKYGREHDELVRKHEDMKSERMFKYQALAEKYRRAADIYDKRGDTDRAMEMAAKHDDVLKRLDAIMTQQNKIADRQVQREEINSRKWVQNSTNKDKQYLQMVNNLEQVAANYEKMAENETKQAVKRQYIMLARQNRLKLQDIQEQGIAAGGDISKIVLNEFYPHEQAMKRFNALNPTVADSAGFERAFKRTQGFSNDKDFSSTWGIPRGEFRLWALKRLAGVPH